MSTTTTPLVSVITCFLNEEKFLQETIESVLAQQYQEWELLLIDDGSTDASSKIAQQYARQYPNKIFYHDHEGHGNIGLSASRNSGIRQAKGELVAFLDADDVWLPQKLGQQVGIMQSHPKVAMLCEASEYWYSWEDECKENVVIRVGHLQQDKIASPPQLQIQLYPLGKGAAPCPSGIMCRKAALEKHGGFESQFTGPYQMYEDQAFLSKFYLNETVYISAACHNRYRQREGSLVQAVTEGGSYHKVRRFYLEWLEKYLHQRQLRHSVVQRLLKKALLPYRQPLLHYITSTLPQQGRKLFRKK